MSTRPPPAWAQAVMASAMATVQSMRPSPTAPWSRMSMSRQGKVGRRSLGMRNGAAPFDDAPLARAALMGTPFFAGGGAMTAWTGDGADVGVGVGAGIERRTGRDFA